MSAATGAGPSVGTPDQWMAARLQLLEREKELTRLRDELAAARRRLPWVRVESDYSFDTPEGPRSLPELFDGRSQLIVYHFMFGPSWEAGCPSCTFWADSFEGQSVHLAHRDVTFAAVSRAPLERLLSYRDRMRWTFPWYSSGRCTFNTDFGVSFPDPAGPEPARYNFRPLEDPPEELPGISCFARHEGAVYHTYSAYSRGLDALNSAYQLLDLAPHGRDEDGLEWSMAWLRRHDEYAD